VIGGWLGAWLGGWLWLWQALLAERNNMRMKNKSLRRDLKKLIQAMEQSVPKAEVQ
jgi:hypothetical protein